MGLKLANNAVSRLTAGIGTSDTSLAVTPGQGALFPALGAGDWFPATIIKGDGTFEIVKVTARVDDVFTITRAQESTSAKTFLAGDRVELRLTSAIITAHEDSIAALQSDKLDTTNTGYVRASGGTLQLSESGGTYSVSKNGGAAEPLAKQSDLVSGVPTGAEMGYYGLVPPAGWVFAAGKTIGNASSGATERANADTQALFEQLWASIANAELPIQDSTGAASTRGASATADFNANKRLPTPDLRGRGGVGKDNMGGTAANRLTTGGSGVNGATLGAAGGAETHTLTTAQMPSHNHGVNDPTHYHGLSNAAGAGGNYAAGGGGYGYPTSSSTAYAATGITIQNNGSGGAHNNTQPSLVRNVILKL